LTYLKSNNIKWFQTNDSNLRFTWFSWSTTNRHSCFLFFYRTLWCLTSIFFLVRTNQKKCRHCRNIFSKFIPGKLKKSATLKRNYPTNHSLAHITFFMKKFFHNKHYKKEQIRNNQNPNRNFVKSKYNLCIPVE